MANKAALVEQIKSIQRSDPDSKQAWWDYCDTNLGGVKDPNRHDATVLNEFVSAYGGSAATNTKPRRSMAPVSSAGGGWGPYPMATWGYGAYPSMWATGGGCSLQDFVKTGQRHSGPWKAAWQTYCVLYGSGFNDPAKYDESFIVGFIDYVGQLAAGDLGAMTEHTSDTQVGAISGMKRPLGGATSQPPAKRAVTGASKGYVSGDAEKAELVDKVKALQRTDPEAKGAWWAFCDENMQGVKDPNRHEKETLQQFLSSYE